MASTEAKLINSVCRSKQVGALLADNVDDLFISHKDIWIGLRKYYMQFKAIPDVSVLQERYALLEDVDAKGEPEFYLDELKGEYLRSRIDSIMGKADEALSREAPARVLAKLTAELGKLNKFTNNVRDLNLTDYEAAEIHFQAVRERSAANGSPGIPTGIKAIDAAYPTGMAPGHLIVAIGWPGKGKTWFTSYLACKAWERGFKPMIVSLEMSPENMRDRIYTLMGSGLFSATDFARGQVDIDNFRAWGQKKLVDKPDFVIVSNEGVGDVTPNTVQAKIEQHRPDIVICDYHQLFTNNNRSNSPVERAMGVSREFKQLAITNNIPLIDITAATADDTNSTKTAPMLNQVAWSKAIEYDADMAFAVHRDPDSGLMQVICRKNRHGSDFEFEIDADLDKGVWKESYGGF
ncbi:DNA helicase [Streptomyces phage Samisti12]|uniref:DNA helicase n=1 Tax=Streptomyces phage Samisti12 TaxID=2023995 RepID=A0A223FZY3_9CAUD|nr:DNA helicase [Streptomyces phage Samisti12]AST15307.1 DNA helicase [Streptomyces phage Samisti12]